MDEVENETIVLINEGRLSELELEKAFALNALKHNPGILSNPITFEKLCFVLNDIKPNMETFEPPSILVVAKAVKELGYDKEWSNEIKYFIAFLAMEEGWVHLPSILEFAQEALNDIQEEIELDEEQIQIQELKHKAIKMYLES
jgi:hypothetical protein